MNDAKKAELLEKYKALIEPSGLFTVEKVSETGFLVNGLAGHPYTIGARHVAEAADHGGILGEEVCEKIGCAHIENGRRCDRPFSEHTTEYGLWLHLTRDMTNKEAHGVLFAVRDECTKDGISGFAMPNLGKRFHIAPPTE